MPMERLNKVLAHAGLGSRRSCDELIAQGRVTVDGETVADLGRKVDPAVADVRCDGERVRAEPLAYYLLNKPRGVVCTAADDERRPRAIDLIRGVASRLYTIGRLDADSRGLIILTNDGQLTEQLTHPRHLVPKTYRVRVRGAMRGETVKQAEKGVHLAEGRTSLARVRVRRRSRNGTELDIELRQGINRQIRRVLAQLGHPVTDLARIAIGPVTDPTLREGAHRRLRPQEVHQLRQAAQAPRARSRK
jgi:23S rRNA pseudouridine2605 synthase